MGFLSKQFLSIKISVSVAWPTSHGANAILINETCLGVGNSLLLDEFLTFTPKVKYLLTNISPVVINFQVRSFEFW
jgi:hypothetical protein